MEGTGTQSAAAHLGLVEQGKLYALEGDHRRALAYYREGIKRTVAASDPEVIFRHYLDCVMESLELTAAFEPVLEYCDKAIELYAERPPPNPIAVFDLASIHQRRGVILMKLGRVEEAGSALEEGRRLATEVGHKLPLASTLLGWLARRMHVDVQRIEMEQKRCKYFAVRKDTVDPARAIRVPNEAMLGL